MISNVMMFGLGMIVIGFIWSFLSNFGIEGKLDFETTKDLSTLVKPSIYEEKTGHIIRIEVLNGCGVRKLAALYRDFLRDQGIDVIRSKNADNSEYEKTIIIRRKGS
ncbi:MAG: LytR C-terminal domain-containing protein, partial [Desulfobacula sp.]|nr:LytR C-terminal domain-containing protein [Desulfobacula sp.]